MPTEGLAQEVTYHSATEDGLIYDPETGRLYISEGDGALWFDDEDNSHWIAWVF